MKKTILSLAVILVLSVSLFADNGGYQYTLDLTKVKDDKVRLELVPPMIETDEVIFRMPKMVPGTYSIYDFGRFVSEFSVFGRNDTEILVEKVDDNSWKIQNAKNVEKIVYWVEDTWDTDIKDNWIFEPAGTEIDSSQCFVLNNHGFFGYFEGMTQIPYVVNVTRHPDFYASTGLNFTNEGNTDRFITSSYNQLVDSPIMYTVPDTTFIQVGNCKVLVSVYHKSNELKSDKVAKWISTILNAQKDFLGGTLPVDKYAFLIYTPESFSGSAGALEHNNSSMYYMPYFGDEYYEQFIKDVAAHEFFHIVTPLTLHSEEIHYFDFTNPQMSEHLWLYEGMTEYNAHLVQVRSGLTDTEEFLDEVLNKMQAASGYNDTLPFTVMSKGCLDIYEDQYPNVYQKGALINMCLDVLILKHSNGQKNLRMVMAQLSDKYGAERPFKDDELFDEIEALTYPEVGNFLRTYVSGPNVIPYGEILDAVGVEVSKGGTQEVVDPGFEVMQLGYDEGDGLFYIMSNENITNVGKKIKFKEGDKIYKIDGKELTIASIMEVFGDLFGKSPGDAVQFEVKRKKGKREKVVKLKGVLGTTTMEFENKLYLAENPTESQVELRRAWINQ